MVRRAFLGCALGVAASAASGARPNIANAQKVVAHAAPQPLVWPLAIGLQPGLRSFIGHANTVLDVIGNIGRPPSLVIFSEGNHLMVLAGADIVGAFPAWAKGEPRYADLDLDNIVMVTLPQPILLQMVKAGGVALGNLILQTSRGSGFYPDIFMGYPAPLRQLRRLGVIKSQARVFCKNRGVALLVQKGNPLGIRDLASTVRPGIRLALPEPGPGGVRAQCEAAASALLGKSDADTLFASEVRTFPGRLGIMHRDLPEMVARDYADAAFTWHHLVAYWARIFPNHFEAIAIPGAEPFSTQIALARVDNPLRLRAMTAFDEFFFGRAREVYPRYEFAHMSDDEFSKTLTLD